jgi:hypothetical protein
VRCETSTAWGSRIRIRGAADGLDALTAGVGSGYLCSAPSEDLQVAIETESHRRRPEFCISSPVSPAAERTEQTLSLTTMRPAFKSHPPDSRRSRPLRVDSLHLRADRRRRCLLRKGSCHPRQAEADTAVRRTQAEPADSHIQVEVGVRGRRGIVAIRRRWVVGIGCRIAIAPELALCQ